MNKIKHSIGLGVLSGIYGGLFFEITRRSTAIAIPQGVWSWVMAALVCIWAIVITYAVLGWLAYAYKKGR